MCLGSSSFKTDIAYDGLIIQTSKWLLLFFLVDPKSVDGRGSYIHDLTSASPWWHSHCEQKEGTFWTSIVSYLAAGWSLQASLSIGNRRNDSVGHSAFSW